MARDLSPYSARLLLTRQLAEGKSATPQPSPRRHASPPVARNESGRPTEESAAMAPRRSRSRSKERRPRASPRDRNPRDGIADAGTVTGERQSSPQPYKPPRDSSVERKRGSSRDRKRDRSRDRRRDRSRERRRARSGERKKGRSRERQRDRSRERRRDHSKDRVGRKERSCSRDRRRKDNSKERRRSRSPIPYRSRKPRTRSPSASASPPPKRRRKTRSPSPHQRTKKALPSQEISFRGLDDSAQAPTKYGGAPPDKEKPNFKTTGALAKAANRVEGTKISLKYNEPAEARKPPPSQPWRIFVFKGEDVVDTIEIWQKSCWLLGRSHEVVDYVLEHPSSSGQHAVIQFRYIQKTIEDEFGVKTKRGKVKPYIIDLESSNGTELNGETVEASRYFELRDKDILKFAGSEREYVVMLPPPEASR
ncbi:SMAD/FHA domain-containing protein [Plenodomus tracheiphilus IPT5]|uniref:SMAD/FHA domain-containing protein n=1 Tax=Plenodomus tracheiphilus IPT5 TaxID=1408161 RepID=A0A6A7B7B1_9PLEO|nr:SMAD/FHA domain-containing protein [Plenodomus tracheiphilus IPT5]